MTDVLPNGRRWYLWSVVVILTVTGAGKIYSGLSTTKMALQSDPLLGFQFRSLLITVGIFELAIAVVCALAEDALLKAQMLLWFSMSIVSYRIGLVLIDYSGPCKCLGSLTEKLGLDPTLTDAVMKALLAYIAVGGVVLCATCRKERRVLIATKPGRLLKKSRGSANATS